MESMARALHGLAITDGDEKIVEEAIKLIEKRYGGS
jgi:hypothetical protein